MPVRTQMYRHLTREAVQKAPSMGFKITECQRMLGYQPAKRIKTIEQIVDMIGSAVNHDTLHRAETIRMLAEKYWAYVYGPPQHRIFEWKGLLDRKPEGLLGRYPLAFGREPTREEDIAGTEHRHRLDQAPEW